MSLDLAGLRDVEVDRRSLTARLGAGLRGPEAESGARRRRADARPLPAVVPVRDDRRLRRDPLGGPGLERIRALRRPGQLGPAARPGRRDPRPSRPRTPPPGPPCASSSIGSEGVLGVIPDVTVRVRPAPRGPPLRGLDRGELRGRGRDRPHDGPGAGPAGRDPRLRRGGDRASRSRSRGRAGSPAGSSTATSGSGGRRGGCLIVVGIDGDEESVARRRALAVRALRAGGAAYLGQVRRAQLGPRPLRRPLPARHADGHGGDRRDARDLPHLVPPRRAPRGGRPMRSAARSRPRARPGWPSATSRTPTPTAPRSTSPSSPAPATAPSSSSGARSSAPPRRRSSPPAATITHHHAIGRDHAPLHGGGGREHRDRGACARSRSDSTRPGS